MSEGDERRETRWRQTRQLSFECPLVGLTSGTVTQDKKGKLGDRVLIVFSKYKGDQKLHQSQGR